MRQVFLTAATILLVSERWTQQAEARHLGGTATHALDPNATSWSLTGALEKAVGRQQGGFWLMTHCLRRLRKKLRQLGAPFRVSSRAVADAWNDKPMRKHADVVKVLLICAEDCRVEAEKSL